MNKENWQPKYTIGLITILAITSIAIVSILRDRIVNDQFRTITVNGRGKVQYQPNLATINVGVQIDKLAKPEEALNQLNSKIAKIKEAVKKLGIEDANIDTKNYSLSTQYDYKDSIQVAAGYNANQQLSIKVKDLEKNKELINKIVAEAGKAGANQINGVVFSSEDLENYKQEARLKAIADAKAKAQSLADVAGVSLGDINGWYDNVVYPEADLAVYSKGGVGGGGVSTDSQISAGSNEVTVDLGLTFKIHNK